MTDRLNILQVHNRYRQRGGEDTVADSEAEILENAGHDVTRLVTQNPTGLGAIESLARASWNSRSYRLVNESIARDRPAVAHVHNTWFDLSPSVISALAEAEIPTVWTSHNYRFACTNGLLLRNGVPCVECVGASPWRAVRYSCYRDPVSSLVAASTIARAAKRRIFTDGPSVIVALTEFARGIMIESGFDAERVVVKPNFSVDPGPRTINAGSSDFYLFVGRLSPEKGIDILIEAWQQVGSMARLILVGDGADYDSSKISSLSSDGLIQFVGRQDQRQVADLMLRARGLIFPSIWFEGQPMVLIEALAAGLPIIGSDIGALPEIIQNDRFDGLFEVGNSESLAQKVLELDDRTADEASRTARTDWESRFSPDVGLAGLEETYRLAMSRVRA